MYRWYPPMMLMTTALAAVFCWMYISKPVFITAPAEQPMEIRPAIEDEQPVPRGQPAAHTAGGGILDPAIGRLPGDPVGDHEGPPEADIPMEELKPLIVKRRGPSLFRPIPANGISERTGIVVEDPGPGTPEQDGGDWDPVPEDSGPGPGGGGKDGYDSGSQELRVHASFMAEFSPIGPESDAQPDLKQ